MNGYNTANYDQAPSGWTYIQTAVIINDPYHGFRNANSITQVDSYTYEYNNVVFSLNGETPISYPGYHQSDVIRAMA